MKNRHSIRLKNYDYSSNGAYFVTICTKNKEMLFGDIVDGKMELNNMGKMVESVWQRNYFEHIIRNNIELNKIREYIILNPEMSEEDCNNPEDLYV